MPAPPHFEPSWGPPTLGGRLNHLFGGLITGAVGVAVLILGIWIIFLSISSADWVETPATILRNDEDEVRFSYEFSGQKLESDSAYLWSGFLSGAPGTLTVPPAGATTRCWVDPAHPEKAVLTREFLLAALMAFCFALPWLTVSALKWLSAVAPRQVARACYRRWFQAIPQLVMEGRLPSWVDSRNHPPHGVYSLREARARGWEQRVLVTSFMIGLGGCFLLGLVVDFLTTGLQLWMVAVLLAILGLWTVFVLLPELGHWRARQLPVYFLAVENLPDGKWRIHWALEPGQPAPRSLRLAVVKQTGYSRASGAVADWWRGRILQRNRGIPAENPDQLELAVAEASSSQLERGSALLDVSGLAPELLEANLVTMRARMESARGLWAEDEIVFGRTWAGLD